MSWLTRLWNHTRSTGLSQEIDREMAFHVAERADELIARGMAPDHARVEAMRQFGHATTHREDTRESNLFGWLEALLQDLRYGARSLRATPVFTIVTVLSLALGIGANTAIFSIINAVMLKSLPVAHPEELVALTGRGDPTLTNPIWEAFRDRQDVFDGAFAYASADFNLSVGGPTRRIAGAWVSGDYFSTLGVRTIAGRPIVRGDDARGCAGVTVLSEGFWREEYGGDPAAVGKTISFDGHPFSIVGIAPASFRGLSVGERPSVYVPLCAEAIVRGSNSQLDERASWWLQVVGRRKPDLGMAQIDARVAALSPGITQATVPTDFPAEGITRYLAMRLGVTSAEKGFSDLRSTYRKALYILMTIAGTVLLIACANIINLLLARAAARRREMAVRLALGASRARLARQTLTESLLLSGAGASLGVAVAFWASSALVALLSRTDHVVSLDLSLDLRVLGFTVAVAMVTGLVFGVVPAWRAGRVDPQLAMKAQERGIAGGRLRGASVLVTSQIALSLVLVAGAGLLAGSWRRLTTADTGFRTDHALLVDVDIRGTNTPAAARYALFSDLLRSVRALPGVRAAGGVQITPMSGSGWNDRIIADGYTPRSERESLSFLNAATDGYFDAAAIRLIAGREFTAADVTSSTQVAVVTESFAKKFFGGSAALGRRFELGFDEGNRPIEIVGIVADTKYRSMRDSGLAIAYFPRAQARAEAQRLAFLIRTDGPPSSIVPALRTAVAAVNPRIAMDIVEFDRQVSESLRVPRTIGLLSAIFASLALLIAAIGLYGLLAYGVARRRVEIGVRIALGAGTGQVVRMVAGNVARLVAAGSAIGLAVCWLGMKGIKAFLYGVQPNDPVTLGGAVIVLALVAAAAAALPTWRAASLEPVTVLRED